MIILIKLIAAHLLGDFVLQSDKLCKMKYGKSLSTRLYALGLHSFIQAILSYLFVAEWSNFTLPIVIGVSHFCIDWLKVQTGKKGLIPLIVDQIFHYLVLFVIYWANQSYGGCLYYSYNSSYLLPVWLVTTSFIAVLSPTSILIKAFIDYENWLPKDASLK